MLRVLISNLKEELRDYANALLAKEGGPTIRDNLLA